MAQRKKKNNDEPPSSELATQIKKATSGLYYSSETDAEVKLFAGEKTDEVTSVDLLNQIKFSADTPVALVDFEEFFSRLTAIQTWFGDEEKQTAAKFAALHDLLKNNLTNLNVFKVGSIEIDIYAVGLDAKGILTGIKTKAVET